MRIIGFSNVTYYFLKQTTDYKKIKSDGYQTCEFFDISYSV